jgi:class 3 adenylate cyclase/pimeloyl-ACP methyl ester carboxylesterase
VWSRLVVVTVPTTSYARTAEGLHIAYQVFGDGPVDLVFVSDWRSHLEAIWEEPQAERFLRRLATFSRVICFDKRGTGLSDPVGLADLPSLESWADDLRVVLDAVSSREAYLVGHTGGGPICVLFAATHPERTRGLVLSNTYARLTRDVDHPIGIPAPVVERYMEGLDARWGTGGVLELTSPTAFADERLRSWWGHFERLAAGPGAAVAMQRAINVIDVRRVLPVVATPTLVVHRRDLYYIRADHGRYLAANIAGAEYAELNGSDQLFFIDAEDLLGEIEGFVTGRRARRDPDRVLATVVFVDIVASTKRVAEVGDRSWVLLLERFLDGLRRQVDRFGGVVVNGTGDGLITTFDGPGRAIRCSLATIEIARAHGLEVRCGIHTGEVERSQSDIAGLAVHVAQRICATADPGTVLVSRTTADVVAGSSVGLVHERTTALRGVPGEWQLFRATE